MSTTNLNFTTSGADVTQQLITALAPLGSTDTVVVHFGAGTFHISNAVVFRCNTVITGEGSGLSKVVCDSSVSLTNSDTYLTFRGTKVNKTSVEISHVEISLSEHTGILWVGAPRHLMKIVHSNKVGLHNIRSYCSNAAITNIDMRVCSNVAVSDCELINYNNCTHGGVLWLRNDMTDVRITGNRLVKYGNDEILAFWLPGDEDSPTATPTSGIKKNILIAANDIVYEKPLWADNIIAGVQISLFNDYDADNPDVDVIPTTFSNFTVVNNRITVSAPVTSLFNIIFGSNDSHDRIVLSGNSITCTATSSAQNSHFTMFMVQDKSGNNVPVIVENNVISSAATTTDHDNYSNSTIFHLTDSCVKAEANIFAGIYDKVDGKSMGMIVLWPHGGRCSLTLTGNKFRGINKIGQFSHESQTGDFDVTLVARGNIFSGDTRCYCKNLNHGYLTFENNIFISDCYEMLLQEFADGGSLVFNDNEVYILFCSANGTYQGRLFVHYTEGLPANAHFDTFEVTGNVVRGTSQSIWLGLPNTSACSTYTVSGNTFHNRPW